MQCKCKMCEIYHSTKLMLHAFAVNKNATDGRYQLSEVRSSWVLTHWGLMTPYDVVDFGLCRFRKWLVAYSAPSHYLNQCWSLVKWAPGTFFNECWIKIQKKIYKENEFVYSIGKMVVILLMPQCVTINLRASIHWAGGHLAGGSREVSKQRDWML